MTRFPPPPTALTTEAAGIARRWQRALAQLASTHPAVAADCLQTLERLTHNLEQFVQEAAAAQAAPEPVTPR